MNTIKNIDELLKMDLNIPDYQRPYKWCNNNIIDLLSDIENAIQDYTNYEGNYNYRIGTIILHNIGDNKYDIVDGQQRIISLILLKLCINRRNNKKFSCSILEKNITDKTSKYNINKNYAIINEFISLKNNEYIKKYELGFNKILEVVVICVDKIEEAFQLFDSQNTRGKELDPHDLLKAYHLREMNMYPEEMKNAVRKWEEKEQKKIRDIFDLYLFPILNWSRKNKSKPFTTKEIDIYKGISESSEYMYALRAKHAMPYFQITEPFISGSDFFKMVDYYIQMLDNIMNEISNNEKFSQIYKILNRKSNSVGYGYAKNLFKCSLLYYYDKFYNFNELAVKKLFRWAFMIRIDMKNLGFDTINKYAIGDIDSPYTNIIPMFSLINTARIHTEISNLQIKIKRNPDKPAVDTWDELYNDIKEMN